MKKVIIPAIIAKTQKELEDILSRIKDSARRLQLDIMDNKFVPNTSLDFDFELPQGKYEFEAHLMIENPEEWIDRNWKKVETIIAHFETLENPGRIVENVRRKGKKIAFALNPDTGVNQIKEYLTSLDQVLVMTVHPGFYGGKFLPEALEKIRRLRELKPDLDIEVDGGINDGTISAVNEAGANLFVSGSYLVGSGNVEERIKILKAKIHVE